MQRGIADRWTAQPEVRLVLLLPCGVCAEASTFGSMLMDELGQHRHCTSACSAPSPLWFAHAHLPLSHVLQAWTDGAPTAMLPSMPPARA